VDDALLGGYIGNDQYCHTFSSTQPSCYTQALHEATTEVFAVAPDLAGTAWDIPLAAALRRSEEAKKATP
jgi:hypothetical protein